MSIHYKNAKTFRILWQDSLWLLTPKKDCNTDKKDVHYKKFSCHRKATDVRFCSFRPKALRILEMPFSTIFIFSDPLHISMKNFKLISRCSESAFY